MQISNFKLHRNLSFEEYQKLPGNSYSSIKSNGASFTPTKKMALGTLCHQYILEPERFKGDTEIIRPLANTLLRVVGASLFKYLICECVITCDMEHQGLQMAYRGKLDMCIPGKIVVDLKIAEDVRNSMGFFGYDKQISGYCLAASAPVGLIIAVNPKTRKSDIIKTAIKEDWWHEQILLKGNVCQQS